jgi:hypothetical protein
LQDLRRGLPPLCASVPGRRRDHRRFLALSSGGHEKRGISLGRAAAFQKKLREKSAIWAGDGVFGSSDAHRRQGRETGRGFRLAASLPASSHPPIPVSSPAKRPRA